MPSWLTKTLSMIALSACSYCIYTNEADNSKHPGFSLTIPAIIKNLTKEKNQGIIWPVASLMSPSGFGLEHGQISASVGGGHCHWGENNCQMDGAAHFGVGWGNAKRFISANVFLTINSISWWKDDGFADRGWFSFSLQHTFTQKKLAVKVGAYGPSSWGQDKQIGSYYLVASHYFTLKTKSEKVYPIIISLGIGNGVYSSMSWFTHDWENNLNKFMPFGSVAVQLNNRFGVNLETQRDGVWAFSTNYKLFNNHPWRIYLGVDDIFTRSFEQTKPSVIGGLLL
jgi:hypothetical protein